MYISVYIAKNELLFSFFAQFGKVNRAIASRDEIKIVSICPKQTVYHAHVVKYLKTYDHFS